MRKCSFMLHTLLALFCGFPSIMVFFFGNIQGPRVFHPRRGCKALVSHALLSFCVEGIRSVGRSIGWRSVLEILDVSGDPLVDFRAS